MLKPVYTRFRAYQLDSEGSSFSYFADNTFTLIEARISEKSISSLAFELHACGKETIDVLHITGWDIDHCCAKDLESILEILKPKRIEYPGYEPHTDNAKECLKLILEYKRKQENKGHSIKCRCINPEYIDSLEAAKGLGYKNIFYHPKEIIPGESNDNSTVKLFREGAFNVASLGDVESGNISSYLRSCKIFSREVDVLILPHHGADNGFITKKFLNIVRPAIAICGSNFGNKFDHPKQEIRDLLFEENIPIFTTKTGDVFVESIGQAHKQFSVTNLICDSSKVSSKKLYTSKKSSLLSHNMDSVKNMYGINRRRPLIRR